MKINSGQTFVEVIIIVSIVIIVVTALVSGSIASLKVTGYNSLKSQATKFAQEGIELSRKDRDLSWNIFSARANGSPWCLDKNGVWSQTQPCPVNIDVVSPPVGTFTRSVVFAAVANGIDTTVTVTWQDGATTRTSKIQTLFTKWR